MTPVTPNEVAFRIGYSLVLNSEGSGGRHLGQRCTRQILAMACSAAVLIVLVVILMTIVKPTGIVYVVKTMRAICCKWQTS